MSDAPEVIEDICWELFGGSCGVLKTKDEMAACPRKIRTCDAFVPLFRKGVGLLRAAQAAEKAPRAEKQEKPGDKGKAKVEDEGKAEARVEDEAWRKPPYAPTPGAGGVRFVVADGKAGKVEVAGSFNNWKAEPLARVEGTDLWTAILALPAGEHLYKFVVDGEWRKPADAPAYAADGAGAENGVLKL